MHLGYFSKGGLSINSWISPGSSLGVWLGTSLHFVVQNVILLLCAQPTEVVMPITPIENLFTHRLRQDYSRSRFAHAPYAAPLKERSRVVQFFLDLLRCFVPHMRVWRKR